MSFAIRFLFVITFLWKEKILLGRLNVLVNVKQKARSLAGIGRAYLGIGSDVSGPYHHIDIQRALISAFSAELLALFSVAGLRQTYTNLTVSAPNLLKDCKSSRLL